MRGGALLLRAAWVSASVALVGACGSPDVPRRPRAIVLVSLDTLRADHLNLYGYERYETSPALDAFARDALVFDHCVVSEPHTLSSHMSLFTGLYPQHHGVTPKAMLPEGIVTLASMLRERGYATAGLADGGYLIQRFGFDRGFDVYRARRRRGLATILGEAREWLELHGAFPFFLFLHTYDVHSRGALPRYESPQPFRGSFSLPSTSAFADPARGFEAVFRERQEQLSPEDRAYIRATYAEGVRYVDSELGGFLELLKELGIYDDALIVVWSDHGEGLGDHGHWLHDALYDATIRCALIMKVPGIRGGRRIRSVVSAVDIAPTLLELAGAPPVPGMDGRSFLPRLLLDEGGGEAFSQRLEGGRSFSIRTPTHQLIWDDAADRYELYDLQTDPLEAHNLSPSGTTLEDDLRGRLQDWVAREDASSRRRAAGPAPKLGEESREELRRLGYLE